MYDVHIEPPNMERNLTRRHPLIFFLHGAGERGTEARSWTKQVTWHGPWQRHGCPQYRKSKQSVREIERFFVAAPHLPGPEDVWEPERLRECFEQILAPQGQWSRMIDRERCYLTGVSLGGRGALEFAIRHPHLFAAVAPVCPFRTADFTPDLDRLGALPMWLFHGGLDGRDPDGNVTIEGLLPGNSLDVYRSLASPRNGLSIIPEVGHDVWIHAYNTPALYRWFLEQRRG